MWCALMSFLPSSDRNVYFTESRRIPCIKLFRASPEQENLFSQAYDGFWESFADETPSLPEMGDDHVFYASLLTPTCYQMPVAEMIGRFLAEKMHLNEDFQQRLQTALQELVMNAVLHGNLEVAERFESSEGFNDYCKLVDGRLKQPAYVKRRVTILVIRRRQGLTLRVIQEGATFYWKQEEHNALYQGRGIALIRACGGFLEAGNGSHEVSVTFRLEDEVSEKTPDALKQAKILLVDDAAFNVNLLKEALRERGFEHCLTAHDGRKALEMTLEHRPDIIILDLMMPGMSGYECCERLRRMPEFKDLPILVLTMLKEPEERAKAFRAGASDLVNKPVHVEELMARVTLHLQRKFSMGRLNRYHDENEQELQSARKMQEMLLPSQDDIRKAEKRHGLTIFSHVAPCAKIGGDFWGMAELPDKQLALFMVDFSGHGVTAALNTFRLHAIIMELQQAMHHPGEFLSALNERLYQLLGADQFATMFCGVVDAKTDSLRYAAAASPAPLIITGDGKAHYLEGRGFPLGVRRSARYETHDMPFHKGDFLLLYSDALLEGVNEHLQAFEDRFLGYAWHHTTAEAAFKLLLADFYAHTHGAVADDLTVNLYFRKT